MIIKADKTRPAFRGGRAYARDKTKEQNRKQQEAQDMTSVLRKLIRAPIELRNSIEKLNETIDRITKDLEQGAN